MRRERRLSQERLGELVGVSYQQIQKYENGRNVIGVDRLHRIARALGVSAARLLEPEGRVAEPGPPPYLKPEEQELLDRFRAIRNRRLRALVLELARMVSRRPGPPKRSKRRRKENP